MRSLPGSARGLAAAQARSAFQACAAVRLAGFEDPAAPHQWPLCRPSARPVSAMPRRSAYPLEAVVLTTLRPKMAMRLLEMVVLPLDSPGACLAPGRRGAAQAYSECASA